MEYKLSNIPNLFIVGAPKCGSTSMWYYLSQHKEVFMVKEKEPQFFNDDLEFSNRPTVGEYDQMYSSSSKEKYLGEASPLYLISKTAAINIKKVSPDAKIIIMIRKPSDLLYSIYLQNKVNQIENLNTFEDALGFESARRKNLKGSINGQPVIRLFYTEFVNYKEHIERFYAHFNKDQIHIILFDDLQKNTRAVFEGVLNFLNLSTDVTIDFDVQNTAKINRNPKLQSLIDHPPQWIKSVARMLANDKLRSYIYWKLWWSNKKRIKNSLSKKTSCRINATFINKIEELESLTGLILSHWKK